MKTTVALSVFLVMICSISAVPAAEEAAPEKPLVQIAVLLDTSNSMDRLIGQAKSQLWSIVSQFAIAKKNGAAPDLYVALYEYGNDNLSAKGGHIRMVQPLTNDLDKISEELFALKTRGGQEYCGWVIKEAVENLKWSDSNEVYKAIFIAGNEPFTQGNVDYRESCAAAIAKGIMVNTIHCGDERTGINTKWKDGADLADGSFNIIDTNRAVVHIDAPQDKEIAELGKKLNDTYVAYGEKGEEGKARQLKEDENAQKIGAGNNSNRQFAKVNGLYFNGSWDLVDAVNNNDVDLEKIAEKDLPVVMQKMTPEERKEYVEKQYKARNDIQNQIKKLNVEREKFVAEKRKDLADGNEETLGEAINDAVRDQAAKKNFEFEKQ